MLAAMSATADMSNPDAHGKICGGDGGIRHKLPVTSFQRKERTEVLQQIRVHGLLHYLQ
jgi:hypothetical protein